MLPPSWFPAITKNPIGEVFQRQLRLSQGRDALRRNGQGAGRQSERRSADSGTRQYGSTCAVKHVVDGWLHEMMRFVYIKETQNRKDEMKRRGRQRGKGLRVQADKLEIMTETSGDGQSKKIGTILRSTNAFKR